MNKTQLAQKLGVSFRTLTNWSRQGLPVVKPGSQGKPGFYDLSQVLTWMKQTGHGAESRDPTRHVDIERVESELVRRPAVFPDRRTVSAVAQASGASLVRAAALIVRVLGIPPDDALRCCQIAHGEQDTEFDEIVGKFNAGLARTEGAYKILASTGGEELVLELIEKEIAKPTDKHLDLWPQVFEEQTADVAGADD